MSVWICAACGVEHADTPLAPAICPICEDERQYVPRTGQNWITLEQCETDGCRGTIEKVELNLFGITSSPTIGIGQRSLLVCTPHGNLLWDPIGFVDDELASQVRGLGEVVGIIASHPHMYGAQVEWSKYLGDAPIYVPAQDQSWIQRADERIVTFEGTLELVPEIQIHTIGGHFPGSAAALWTTGAEGRGALLTGDGIFPNANGTSVSFMRSYPNLIPLSGSVVDRIATQVSELEFDRIYGNFGGVVDRDARHVIRASADRYRAWVAGEYDDLT